MSMQGSISLLGICDLLQVAGFNHRSFILELENAAGQGEIVLDDGRVTDARLGAERGEPALFRLLSQAHGGSFRMRPFSAAAEPGTIKLKTEAVLMRALATMPPQVALEPDAAVDGDNELLGAEELLQIFENNRLSARGVFTSGRAEETCLWLADGGVAAAEGPAGAGRESVYALLKEGRFSFRLTAAEAPPASSRLIDIASAVMEGLRRRDETVLLRRELAGDSNIHAQETLDALARGELDEPYRLELAKRYLPDGSIAPASVLARLCLDESPAVRQAALGTVLDLPEPVLEAIGNDADTPAPLLRFLLHELKSDGVAAAIAGNPQTPVDALIDHAPRAAGGALAALREREELLRNERLLRAALRTNPRCDFGEKLDELDRTAPRARRRVFTAVNIRKAEVEARAEVVLERPPEDPRKEKEAGKLGPRDIQYLAKRGTLRQKTELICGNDADVAVEVISAPGLPEVVIQNIAESTKAHPAALAWVAGQPRFRRNQLISRALLFNPKTPPHASIPLLPFARTDDLNKIATTRELPDGIRQGARQLLEKKENKK